MVVSTKSTNISPRRSRGAFRWNHYLLPLPPHPFPYCSRIGIASPRHGYRHVTHILAPIYVLIQLGNDGQGAHQPCSLFL